MLPPLDVLLKNKPAGYVPLPELEHFFTGEKIDTGKKKKKGPSSSSTSVTNNPTSTSAVISTTSPTVSATSSSTFSTTPSVSTTISIKRTDREDQNDLLSHLANLTISLDPLFKEVYQSSISTREEHSSSYEPSGSSSASSSTSITTPSISSPLSQRAQLAKYYLSQNQFNFTSPFNFLPYGSTTPSSFAAAVAIFSNQLSREKEREREIGRQGLGGFLEPQVMSFVSNSLYPPATHGMYSYNDEDKEEDELN